MYRAFKFPTPYMRERPSSYFWWKLPLSLALVIKRYSVVDEMNTTADWIPDTCTICCVCVGIINHPQPPSYRKTTLCNRDRSCRLAWINEKSLTAVLLVHIHVSVLPSSWLPVPHFCSCRPPACRPQRPSWYTTTATTTNDPVNDYSR